MEYWIEGKQVTEEEYYAFQKTLTEVEDTYHCAKTIGGGRNSYEATDASGNTWICRSETTKAFSRKSIEKR